MGSTATAPTVILSRVVGFFNPNPWPIIINISAVNFNMTIAPKQYVRMQDGRKINDPLLENYVGADMLAKETCKDGVPQILFPRPAPMIVSGETGVSSSTRVVKDSRGIVQDSSFNGAAEPRTSSANSSIRVYSVQEAIKQGIIRPLVVPKDSAPQETVGAPMRGDAIPDLDTFTARDAKPSEIKKIIQEQGKPVVEPETQNDEPPVAPEILPVEGSETPPQMDQEEVERKTKELLNSLDPTPTPKQPVEKKFVCKADGKSFPKRSRLLYHVQKHFPEREAELMEGY